MSYVITALISAIVGFAAAWFIRGNNKDGVNVKL